MGESRGSTSRRSFLRAVATGSVVVTSALAGCSDVGTTQSENVDDVPEERFEQPRLPDGQRDSLERVEDVRMVEHTERLGGLATVTAYVDGAIYEVTEVTESVTEKTMGQLEDPLVVFFVAKATFEGTATSFVGPENVAEQSTPVFRSELENQGVVDVETVDPREPLPAVEDRHVTEFRGTYETPRVEYEATLPDGGAIPLVVPAQRLATAAFQTVWQPDGDTAIIAGGGYPNEDFETRQTESVTGDGEGDGIDVEVSIDLNLEPEAYRQRLIELVESVE